MKKIPTLFKRVFTPDHRKTITEEVTPGGKWVLGPIQGHELQSEYATVKYDGACCAIIDGEIWKRYDAKQKYGKKPPEGAIPCQSEPDPITGHWPHWVKCDSDKPEDKYFIAALAEYRKLLTPYQWDQIKSKKVTTCEAIGIHFQSNPYQLPKDVLIPHGDRVIPWWCLSNESEEVTFDSIKDFLMHCENVDPLNRDAIEGIVFWRDGVPCCKIKRSDFGFEWPIKKGGQ